MCFALSLTRSTVFTPRFIPHGKIFGERDDKRHHLLALRVIFDVVAPIISTRFYGIGERAKTPHQNDLLACSREQSQFLWLCC